VRAFDGGVHGRLVGVGIADQCAHEIMAAQNRARRVLLTRCQRRWQLRGVAQRKVLIAACDHTLHRRSLFAADHAQRHLAFFANHVGVLVLRRFPRIALQLAPRSALAIMSAYWGKLYRRDYNTENLFSDGLGRETISF